MDLGVARKKAEFLDRLGKLTEDGKVKWTQGRDEFWFKTDAVGRYTYTVNSVDQDDVAPFGFRVYPRSVDEGSPGSSAVAVWEWDMGNMESPVNTELRALYFIVKRNTLGYDSLLDRMFEDLSQIEPGESD